eukprot:m.39966 g.39966  ORF g.39966 m.39966 type:complete len:1183 (+) comp9615_c0_seq1:161-3709(+)
MDVNANTSRLHARASTNGGPERQFHSSVSVKAKHVIEELVRTEKEYVRDLDAIISGYQEPMRQRLPESGVNLLFGNIEDLVKLHYDFLMLLERPQPHTIQQISKAFTATGLDGFMIYEDYYINHPKAGDFLKLKQEDEVFSSMLMGCQNLLGHKLPLANYLLKPVQRLLKYPLLLNEIVKATPESTPGYGLLLDALTLMNQVADNINERKRSTDISKYVQGLQQRLLGWDGPDLITFGQLKDAGDFKVADSSNKKSQRQVLLFEYGIFICKPRQGGFVSVKHHFKMSDVYLQTMLNDPVCFRLTLANDKKVFFTFFCQSQEDKQYWIAKIKKAMIDFYSSNKEGNAYTTNTTRRPKASGKLRRGSLPATGTQYEQQTEYNHHDAETMSSCSSNANTISSSPMRRKDKFSMKVPYRKRFSVTEPLEKPPVQSKPLMDEQLMHNPYAQAGGFTTTAPELRLADGIHLKATHASKHPMQQTNSEEVVKPESKNSTNKLATKNSNSNEACVIKCTFPGGTYTSMIVRKQDNLTIRQLLLSKMSRRGFSFDQCVVKAANPNDDGHEDTLPWDTVAFDVLRDIPRIIVHAIPSHESMNEPKENLSVIRANNERTSTVSKISNTSDVIASYDVLEQQQYQQAQQQEEPPHHIQQTQTTSSEEADVSVVRRATSGDGNGVRRFVEQLEAGRASSSVYQTHPTRKRSIDMCSEESSNEQEATNVQENRQDTRPLDSVSPTHTGRMTPTEARCSPIIARLSEKFRLFDELAQQHLKRRKSSVELNEKESKDNESRDSAGQLSDATLNPSCSSDTASNPPDLTVTNSDSMDTDTIDKKNEMRDKKIAEESLISVSVSERKRMFSWGKSPPAPLEKRRSAPHKIGAMLMPSLFRQARSQSSSDLKSRCEKQKATESCQAESTLPEHTEMDTTKETEQDTTRRENDSSRRLSLIHEKRTTQTEPKKTQKPTKEKQLKSSKSSSHNPFRGSKVSKRTTSNGGKHGAAAGKPSYTRLPKTRLASRHITEEKPRWQYHTTSNRNSHLSKPGSSTESKSGRRASCASTGRLSSRTDSNHTASGAKRRQDLAASKTSEKQNNTERKTLSVSGNRRHSTVTKDTEPKQRIISETKSKRHSEPGSKIQEVLSKFEKVAESEKVAEESIKITKKPEVQAVESNDSKKVLHLTKPGKKKRHTEV